MERYQDRIERVRVQFPENLSGHVSLDALSLVAAMSRFHWHRVYSAMTGETLADAVRRARLNRPAVLVMTTADPPCRRSHDAEALPMCRSSTATFVRPLAGWRLSYASAGPAPDDPGPLSALQQRRTNHE